MRTGCRGLMFVLAASVFALPGHGYAADCWLSVRGSGLKNGTSAANAYSATEGYRSQYARMCWNQTGPGDTMHIMEGSYTMDNGAFWQLKITSANDGSKAPPGKLKRLAGEGVVWIEGPRPVPYQTETKAAGGAWILLTQGAERIQVENFRVSRVADAIQATEGGNRYLRFRNLFFEDTRQNIVLAGHPNCVSLDSCPVKPDHMTGNILIQNTSGHRYSKRHIRLDRGVSNVYIINSYADAGFLDGDFAIGFSVGNPSHDIRFVRCTSRANTYTLTPYWNGDGFSAEKETYHIRWEDCAAFDNGDGGFDIKTNGAHFKNIIALRNNRNIRIWSPDTSVIVNANASYSEHQGGTGSEAGIWTQGSVDCHYCTLHNNRIQVQIQNDHGQGSTVRFYDSIISSEAPVPSEWFQKDEGTQMDLIRTDLWEEGITGTDPQFGKGALASWEGGDKSFNSRRYGKTKGYYHA